MMEFVFDSIEDIVGKGENAGYQYFLLFLQCFQKAYSSASLKLEIKHVVNGLSENSAMLIMIKKKELGSTIIIILYLSVY